MKRKNTQKALKRIEKIERKQLELIKKAHLAVFIACGEYADETI